MSILVACFAVAVTGLAIHCYREPLLRAWQSGTSRSAVFPARCPVPPVWPTLEESVVNEFLVESLPRTGLFHARVTTTWRRATKPTDPWVAPELRVSVSSAFIYVVVVDVGGRHPSYESALSTTSRADCPPCKSMEEAVGRIHLYAETVLGHGVLATPVISVKTP